MMSHPLTPELLVYGLIPASEPQVSPDGTRLLYTLSRTDHETTSANVWMSLIDGTSPRRLTWSGARNTGARWSPDGATICFVSDRDGGSGIFLLPVGVPGEARMLTHHASAISDLAWSPDGEWIAYTTMVDPENPDEHEPTAGAAPRVRVIRRLDYKQDNRGYLGRARMQIFVVNVATGKRRQLTNTPDDSWVPRWSPDSRQLAARQMRPGNWHSQLALIDAASGESRLLGSAMGVVASYAWSPDGARILFAGDTAETWQLDLFLADVASGAVRPLTHDLYCLPDAGMATIAPPAHPIWIDDHHALFHAYEHGASGLYDVDVESGEVRRAQRMDAWNQGLSADREARVFAQAHSSFARVGEISVYFRESGQTRIVTEYNGPVLSEARPADVERFEVRRGDVTIEAWLLKPPEFDPSQRYPVILDVHGGPNGHYGHIFNANQQCLATNGFLVAISNPRGSSSYGRHFTQQVIHDWGGEDYLDLMAVVDAVLERPYADAERTGIYGYSYGGYMTAWTISQTQRFAAAVCGAPCFDLESMFGTSDIGFSFGREQWGGSPHEAREWYAAHSPSTFAHQTRTPTLLLHGEADERCPIGQSEQMFVALKAAGCEIEYVRYPGGSHLFLRGGPAAHRADYYARVLAWFKAHLGDPSAPAPKPASARQDADGAVE